MVRPMYRYLAVIPMALLLAVVIVVGALHAQDVQKQHSLAPSLLQGGEYRDLNWYRRMKLGSAYFVNPSLVKQAVVVYKYPAGSLKGMQAERQAEILMLMGGLAVGEISEDGHIILQGEQDFEVLKKALGTMQKDAVLVTPKQTLGSIEGEPIVSWNPQGPLLYVGVSPSE